MSQDPAPTLSEFEQLGRRDQRKPCPVPAILAKLDAADADRVRAALESDNDDVRRGVRVWLEAKGIDADPRKIAPHRAGRCPCHA